MDGCSQILQKKTKPKRANLVWKLDGTKVGFAELKYWWKILDIRLGFRKEEKLEYSKNIGNW